MDQYSRYKLIDSKNKLMVARWNGVWEDETVENVEKRLKSTNFYYKNSPGVEHKKHSQ